MTYALSPYKHNPGFKKLSFSRSIRMEELLYNVTDVILYIN